jgi:hypothetical protein
MERGPSCIGYFAADVGCGSLAAALAVEVVSAFIPKADTAPHVYKHTKPTSGQRLRHRPAASDRISRPAEIARAQLRLGEHPLDRLDDG